MISGSVRLYLPILLVALALLFGANSDAAEASQASFGVIVEWNGTLKFTGRVPKASDIESILKTAHDIYPNARIENGLQPGSESDSGWSRNGRWGMSQLKKLKRGVLEYSGGYVFLEGIADSQNIIDQIKSAEIGLKPEVQKRLKLVLE